MRETKYYATVRGTTYPVVLREEENGTIEVLLGEKKLAVDARKVSGTPIWSLIVNNASHKAVMVAEGGDWLLDLDGASDVVEIGTERELILKKFAPKKVKKTGLDVVRSPMPGLVLTVRVKPGDKVVAGQSVATVEAMKMENEFRAADAGTVEAVHVSAGTSVAKGDAIVTLKLGGETEET
jgi:propionyl-CoA carboxylase alpha chain